ARQPRSRGRIYGQPSRAQLEHAGSICSNDCNSAIFRLRTRRSMARRAAALLPNRGEVIERPWLRMRLAGSQRLNDTRVSELRYAVELQCIAKAAGSGFGSHSETSQTLSGEATEHKEHS